MKEKAIEYFKFNRKIYCEDHLKILPKDSIAYQATLKEKEFYDIAIKALEQQPCEDCISRSQALKEMKESAKYHANDSREEALLRRDRDIIRALPPVTPQEPCEDWRKISVYKVETDEKVAQDIKKLLKLNNQPLITSVLPAEPKIEVNGIVEVLDKLKADVINIADGRRSISVRSVIKIIDKLTLKQEPILDKIRAEIEKLQKMCDKNDLNLMAQYSAFGMVLDIFDRYKAESGDGDDLK